MIYSKSLILLLVIILFLSTGKSFAQFALDPAIFGKIEKTHDLSLPDWGPYSKRYIGVSNIPDKNSGLRFDLSVFPGFYRRKVMVPNVLYENDYHPWEASPNLEYFSFRHELAWKDQVYTDISYSYLTSSSRLIRVECVNNTDDSENLALHFMASINFPPIKEYSPYTPIYPGVLKMPAGAEYFDALNYDDLKYAVTRPTDNLVADGKMRGEIRADGFINGSGIGENFGQDKGDIVKYKFDIKSDYSDALLLIRYKPDSTDEADFKLSGMVNADVQFKGGEQFLIDTLHIGSLKAGVKELLLESLGNSPVMIDGFIITEATKVNDIKITVKDWNPVPQIIAGPNANSLILKYEDVNQYYGIYWQYDLFEIREWYGRDLSDYFKQMVNEHVMKVFPGEGKGHYTNVFMKPIEMQPKSKKIIYGMVCSGTKEEVEKSLSSIVSQNSTFEDVYNNARKKLVHLPVNPDGQKYTFGIERMQATMASNVVYPVYTQKQYIRHSAPGRWWDCLYTWDSGFIGLGMLRLDTMRAIESLNTYTQEPGAQSAFLHHGSPVPVQHYLFSELWNSTQSKPVLEYFYPRLKQYHEFLAGRLGSTTTKDFKSNVLKTWDYFYNSGGWDDYPPQKYMHDNQLESIMAPVITTAQAIRTAKILKMAAEYLGKKEDIKEYDDDIKLFTNALQKYSWDKESGYFGYVVHDKSGNPTGILKYKDKVNYNMGFDGAYPLIAGICTDEQKKDLIEYLESDKHMWSKAGLSAVDQSAPYYRIDGYWNGTVWMPHQWFFWKTMLDLGESDFAFAIAKRALDVWKTETEASYNCMEHFLIETARGAGWHEFSGLSSPVIMWYAAYFSPGNFNAGLDVWIENKKFDKTNTSFAADLTIEGNNKITSVVACMNPDYQYNVKWNGKVLTYKTPVNGALSIDIPLDKNKKGKLEISRK